MSCVICGNETKTYCSIMIMDLCSMECHIELNKREDIK